tara:strand:+ start:436 stop:951 length:516 start_codon:yes stop_codon:yes gene_type:complete
MFENPNPYMYEARNSTVDSWGKDLTCSIKYKFDQYGFRNFNNYEKKPDLVFFGCSLLFGIGVEKQDAFTSNFNCWNFGLAGKYTEGEILECYNQFQDLKIDCKMVFVWRNKDWLPNLNFGDQNKIYHCLPFKNENKNHVRLLDYVDYDVSGTHWGIKTHQKFGKLLSSFLK